MRNKTFPKENQKKMNETIRDLKAENRRLYKERDFYKKEIEHLIKPSRRHKEHIEQKPMDHDEWKKDFLSRFKKEVLGEKK